MNQDKNVDARFLFARMNDEDFDVIWRMFYHRLFNVAYVRLKNAADADEAAVNTLERAFLKRHLYEPDRGSYAAWIFRIALRSIAVIAEKRQHDLRLLDKLGKNAYSVPHAQESLEAIILKNEKQRLVADAVQNLTDKEREIVSLRYWGGLSFNEIAAVLGTSRAAADMALRRALKKLRERLHGEFRNES